MEDVWRCAVCAKSKDLHGPHLDGKQRVRSDCWPCAKKQVFVRESAAGGVKGEGAGSFGEGSSGGGGAQAPFIYTTAAAAAAASPATTRASSSHNSSHSNSVSVSAGVGVGDPFRGGDITTAASVRHFASAFMAVNTGTNAKAAARGTADATNPFAAKTSSATTAAVALPLPPPSPLGYPQPVCSRPQQIVMEKSDGTSPPFTFKAVTPCSTTDPTFCDPNSFLPSSSVDHSSPLSGLTTSTTAAWPTSRGRQGHTASTLPSIGAGLPPQPQSASSSSANPTLSTPHSSVLSPFRSPPSASDSTWVCSECGKAKALEGPHLKGKTSVRSDCWPCGRKRLFILLNSAELSRRSPSASASRPPAPAALSSLPKSAAVAPLLVATQAAPTSAVTAGKPRVVEAAAETGGQGGGGGAACSWYTPVIPPNEAVTDFYLFPEDAYDELHSEAVFTTAGREAATVTVTASQRMQALFNAQVLQCYRLRVVGGVPLRAVWSSNVLYVIAEEPPAATLLLLSGTGTEPAFQPSSSKGKQTPRSLVQDGCLAYEMMGRFAALLMAIESKLATSRFRRMRRLFCSSVFSFAAGCCYASQFASSSSSPADARPTSSPSASSPSAAAAAASATATAPFTIFGPSPDITTTPTIWHRVIESCPLARPCVVSEEQRIRAAQQLYRRVSWLAMPADLSGAAIQLVQEGEDGGGDTVVERRRGGGEGEHTRLKEPPSPLSTRRERCDGVDVVLLPGTMRLEDLPAAAALALPVKQF